jgi:probable rRNA maturation factor
VKKPTVPGKLVHDIVRHVIAHYLPPDKEYELGLHFVRDRAMIQLNKMFFKRTYATDVIAAPVERDSELPVVLLGDIFICTDTAARQAGEYGHSFRREIALLTAHGILHLLGYDDLKPAARRKMRVEEQKILRAVLEKK